MALDARLSAERENEPLTGIDWQKAAATFASPWPTSSWFSSQGLRVRSAITLQLDIASMKLISAITKAAGSSSLVASQLISGMDRPGRPSGNGADDATAALREPERKTGPGRQHDHDQHAGNYVAQAV